MQASPDATIITDMEGRPIYRSPRALEMLRLPPGEIGERESIMDLIAPEWANLARDNFRKVQEGEAVPNTAYVLLRADGTMFQAEVGCMLLQPSRAHPPSLLWMIRDTNEVAQARNELIKAERRSHSIIQVAPWGMHFYEQMPDGSLRFTGANPSADRILGIDHRDLVGRTLQETFPALVHSDMARICAEVAATGRPWHSEQLDYQHHQITGAFEVHVFQIAPGSMVVMFMDITGRVQAEELSTALNRLNAHISSTLDYDVIMQRVVEEGCKALGCDSALINLREGDRWIPRFVHKLPEQLLGVPRAVEDSPTSMLVAQERRALAFDDAQNDPRVDQLGLRDLGVQSMMVAPIIILDDVVGVIAFHNRTRKVRFSEAQLDFAHKLRASLSLAMENARLYEAVRDKGKLLESIIGGAPTGFLLFDGEDLSIKLINEFFKSNFLEEPFKSMDLTGMKLHEFIPGAENTMVPKLLRQVARTGVPFEDHEFELSLLKRGTTYWDLVYYPIGEEGDRDVLLIANDVTEQIKARMLLEDLAMQTEHESARLRTVLENLPMGVAIVDPSGKMVDFNQMYMSIWGLGTPLVDGSERYSSYKGWRAEDHVRIEPMDWPTLRTLKDGTSRIGDVIDIQRFDGRMSTIMHSVASIKDAGGNVIGVVVVVQDISDRIRLDRELQKQAMDLSRSNEELRAFAYVASHDLQEPLRMIINSLSLLERHYQEKLDARGQRYISIAVEGGGRMKELIDDLLTYSRLDAEQKGFAPVDMNQVVAHTLVQLATAIEESHARIVVDQLPTIMGEETQMGQVMQNLLSNAIKFRGSEAPLVEVSCAEERYECIFSVKDNGIGFSMEYADRIFQMFQRLHTREDYPGTGIGLPIVKKIVERHGGRIWAHAEEGKGADFLFSIPKKAPHLGN